MQFGLLDLEVVFGPGVLLDDPDDLLFVARLGYSPPFGPVWDPVLTAAKVLSGDLE